MKKHKRHSPVNFRNGKPEYLNSNYWYGKNKKQKSELVFKNPEPKESKSWIDKLESNITYKEPDAEAYDGSKFTPVNDEPLSFDALKSQMIQPQNELKSFEQWQQEKRECETAEQWEVVKAGVEAAPNLTQKQKDFLIKYS